MPTRMPNSPPFPDAGEESRKTRSQTRVRRILVVSTPFPSCTNPSAGVFVKERVRAIADMPGYEVRVLSPIPYFPPIRQFPRWYAYSQFPREEILEGIRILRPRFFLPPKVGGYFESSLMYGAACRAVERIRREFDFDLIDAHWVYPNGVVAVRLAERYQRPVVMTGRGEDMCCSPGLPLIGRRIRHALKAATQCIGVSQEIAEAMVANGADRQRVSVIPNGVDCGKFRPLDKLRARHRLGLPSEAKIILSVGDRFENKGFHLLVDAVTHVRRDHPNAFLVIVGGAPRNGTDYTGKIQERIEANRALGYVRVIPRQTHEELVWWYNAADVFALLSAREGSPNALMEALACAVPAVATRAGGIPEVLRDPDLGILLPERSADAAAAGIREALSRPWNRSSIRTVLEARAWRTTAEHVARVFERALSQPCSPAEPALKQTTVAK